ncbi:MAG TPA: hypothetical protein VH914_14315 [Acidimicrobiia bacterium]|nr:hypothetical protein [Acidimicrobiia bacterium]
MQTLEPDPAQRASSHSRFTWMAGGVAAVVAAAAISYAVGTAHEKTKTVVQTVSATPAKSTKAAPTCIPGAAPTSCNTDEAKELAIPDQPLNAPTRTVLSQELVAARAAALRYPTVADAENAHMLQAGQFSPLTGAHFINIGAMVPHGTNVRYGGFDASQPQSLIYDGSDPTSRVIGVMYLSLSVLPPQGFAGPNDHWHRHTNTCVVYQGAKIVVPFAADSDVTEPMCAAKHGQFMRETAWMVHAWVVPGWESPSGVFSHDNSDVRCANGSLKTDAVGFCQGT